LCARDEDDLAVEVRVGNSRVEAYLQPRAQGAYKLFLVVLSSHGCDSDTIKSTDWVSHLRPLLVSAAPSKIAGAGRRGGARMVIEPISKDDAFRALSSVSGHLRALLTVS
jgi:hypothetical protein